MEIEEMVTSLLLCGCRDCLKMVERLRRQIEHPFYKEAEAFREEIKMETMKKAAEKYPEPFNPFSWTIEELAKHAMAENYDQQNYIFGMYEVLRKQEEKIKEQAAEIERLNDEMKIWRYRLNGGIK